MSFSDFPPWVYALLVWYAFGVWAVGALFAGIVRDREPLPIKQRWAVWLFALGGVVLFIYVACNGYVQKGFVLTEHGARRLRKKIGH